MLLKRPTSQTPLLMHIFGGSLTQSLRLPAKLANGSRARLAELRTQTQAADRAVQDFKANSNIIETPQGLVSEQQLAEVSTQLTTARAQTEEARARFAQVTEILSKHLSDAAITDAVRSDVISRLRQQYLDLSLREAELSNRVSSNHPALVYLRNEMQGIQQAIRQELQRIGETYRGEFEIAHQREIALQSRLETITRQTAQTNQDRVILRELESRAQTYRALADAFLQRFTVAVQQVLSSDRSAYDIRGRDGYEEPPKNAFDPCCRISWGRID